MTARFLERVWQRRWLVVALVALILVVSLLGGYFGGWGWVGVSAHRPDTQGYDLSAAKDALGLVTAPHCASRTGDCRILVHDATRSPLGRGRGQVTPTGR